MATVELKRDELLSVPVDKSEVLRYMRSPADERVLSLIDECISEVESVLSARICYEEYEISFDGGEIDLGFCRTDSRDLSKNLSECKRAVVFAATVGIGIDRLIKKYSLLSPSRALCIGAIGNERVEALCDIFCSLLASKYKKTRPRYSAGYGDLPLSLQEDIFKALDCAKSIGVSLGDSLLMTPQKSVTAIVGIE